MWGDHDQCRYRNCEAKIHSTPCSASSSGPRQRIAAALVTSILSSWCLETQVSALWIKKAKWIVPRLFLSSCPTISNRHIAFTSTSHLALLNQPFCPYKLTFWSHTDGTITHLTELILLVSLLIPVLRHRAIINPLLIALVIFIRFLGVQPSSDQSQTTRRARPPALL